MSYAIQVMKDYACFEYIILYSCRDKLKYGSNFIISLKFVFFQKLSVIMNVTKKFWDLTQSTKN